MSLSSEDMMKLMAYADGELEGGDLEEAQKLLASNPDSVRFVEQLGGLGELVQVGHNARSAKAIAKFDIADAVMAAADARGASEKPSNVASIAARRNRAEPAGPRLKAGATIVAVLALAASIFLVVQHRNDEAPMAKAPVAPAVQPAATVAAVSSGTAVGGSGVSVSTVNSPGNSVSVFYLPTANELSTSVVVWVDETGEK